MISLTQSNRVQAGIASMTCCSLTSTFQMVFGRMVKDALWPYWRIMIVGNILLAFAFGAMSIRRGDSVPEASQRKWVAMRALFSSLSFVSVIIAVQVNGAPGDVSALTSINIVFAGFMGHLFLAEKMRPIHVVIMSCSVVGAVLISQPSFIFGGEGGSWIGYVLALFSGFFRATSLISSRKSVGVPVPLLACATSMVGVPFMILLAFTPFSADPPFGRGTAEPLATFGLVLVAFFSGLIAISAATLGSLLCPAAVSATVFTGTGMVSGYLAQTLLFDATPGWLTISGAALMLFAVMATAATRIPQQAVEAQKASADQQATAEMSAGDSPVPTPVDEGDEDTESLASFVASEFSSEAAHEAPLRRRAQSNKALPERIGIEGVTTAVIPTGSLPGPVVDLFA